MRLGGALRRTRQRATWLATRRAATWLATRRVATWLAIPWLVACGGGLSPLPPGAAPAPEIAVPVPVSAPATSRPTAEGPLSAGVTEADLDALWLRQLMVPVSGIDPAALRNDYDARRGSRSHRALDLLAPKGTPVLATDDGVIGRVDKTPIGGNIVYYYAHLDRHAKGLAVGDVVRKGDVIGYVGTTGNAPANIPHLHFQVMLRGTGRMWWDGPALNPFGFFVFSGTANQ
jgi:peptidoglycan LD-endopeptidase LytH